MDANKQAALTFAANVNYNGTPNSTQIVANANQFYNFITTVADNLADAQVALDTTITKYKGIAVPVNNVSAIIVDATVYYNYMNSTTPPIVNAQTPVISTQPSDATYAQNATAAALTVVGNVGDGGTLTYQWYSNTVNSNTGGTLITGATATSYAPPTTTIGTTYYYVIITNTNNTVNGNTVATATSNPAGVIIT
jgi:hypothetical protein